MNTIVPILYLKGTFGSKLASKLHWPGRKHSTHYSGLLSNTEWVQNWLERTKCINRALRTNMGCAYSGKTALVKLDPWGFLMLFSICLLAWIWTALSAQHMTKARVEGSHWVSLNFEQPLGPRGVCLFDTRAWLCAHSPMCVCIRVIVWSLQSLIP